MPGIEVRLKEYYCLRAGFPAPDAYGRWIPSADDYWRAVRGRVLQGTLDKISTKRTERRKYNHETRREMERHPLNYPHHDLVVSGVADKLMENPEALTFEERYYVQTGERFVPSRYPEARYAEAQAQLQRFFDPEFWVMVLEHLR